MASCGGSGSSTAPPSKVSHRAFISNAYSGNLQIMDTQNDTTPFTAQTTNSAGQVIPGVPVTISVGTSLTFEVVSPGLATMLVYDQIGNVLDFVNNTTEAVSGSVTLPNFTGMALFSPDASKVYAPVRNIPIVGLRPGAVEVIDVASFAITANLSVPSVRYIALSRSEERRVGKEC